MNTSETKEKQYLIIGGTTKAATTSLYYYLAAHPDVCPSTMKETRFFIDEDYPVQSASFVGWASAPDKFDETYFSDASEAYRLEATPDYLYSAGTPQRIKEMLPNAKVIFLLRDPITRMTSWYKYARQRADIPESMSFDEYVDKQLSYDYFAESKRHRLALNRGERNSEEELGQSTIPPSYFFCGLEHGRYARYLQNYLDVLGKDNVKVFCYEDLCRNPQEVLIELCDFASLPYEFYTEYDFKVFNRSMAMKNAKLNRAYDSFRSKIRKRTHNLPIHKGLRQLRLWTDPLYYRLNGQKMEKVEVSLILREKLEDYYRDDVKLLESLLGKSLPWSIQTTKAKVAT
ncbi:MAG: sulfotransferase [Cyanobacteria bacterium J06650_10]